MRLPEIKSQNKIRDLQIIDLYVNNHYPQHLIADKFGISQKRVSDILRKHASLIVSSVKDYEKLKRIQWLNQHLDSCNLPIAKTKLELLEANRKEFENENNQISATQNNIIQMYFPSRNEVIPIKKIEQIN